MIRPVAPGFVVVVMTAGRGDEERGGVDVSLATEADLRCVSLATTGIVVPFVKWAVGDCSSDDAGETARVIWSRPNRSRMTKIRTRYDLGWLSSSQGVTLGSRRPVRALNLGSRWRGQGIILNS